jgi:hypothetical protein
MDVALRHKITRGSLDDFASVLLTSMDAWTNFCHVVKVHVLAVPDFIRRTSRGCFTHY